MDGANATELPNVYLPELHVREKKKTPKRKGLIIKNKAENRENYNRRKVKRSKTTEKALRNMMVYFINARGLKSKLDSMEEIIDELKPDIIGIVESHLDSKDIITIEGYHIVRNDRNSEGGGVMIAVKEKYKHVTMEVTQKRENAESIWITIGNKTKYRAGVVYVPKGDGERKEILQEIDDQIIEEISIAQIKKEKVIVMGDFNCKVGKHIIGNNDEVTKGGRILKKTMEKTKTNMINAWKNCIGTWTRIEKDKQSVLDYIMIEEKEMNNLKKVTVDENARYTPYRMIKENNEEKHRYTDHRAIIYNGDCTEC